MPCVMGVCQPVPPAEALEDDLNGRMLFYTLSNGLCFPEEYLVRVLFALRRCFSQGAGIQHTQCPVLIIWS